MHAQEHLQERRRAPARRLARVLRELQARALLERLEQRARKDRAVVARECIAALVREARELRERQLIALREHELQHGLPGRHPHERARLRRIEERAVARRAQRAGHRPHGRAVRQRHACGAKIGSAIRRTRKRKRQERPWQLARRHRQVRAAVRAHPPQAHGLQEKHMHHGPREHAAGLHADAHAHVLREAQRTHMQRLGHELEHRTDAVQGDRHGERRAARGPQRRRRHVPEVRAADSRREEAATPHREERKVVQSAHRRLRAERRLPPDHHRPNTVARQRQDNAQDQLQLHIRSAKHRGTHRADEQLV